MIIRFFLVIIKHSISQLHKNVLIICFLIFNYLGIRPTWLRKKQLLTVTYTASIIKLLTIGFIWMRSFFSLVRLSLLWVLFIILKLKTLHVFHKCSVTKILWNQLLLFFETDIDLPDLTPQAALFGFINESDNNLFILQNHILLIFKLYVNQSRERGVLNLNGWIKNVTKVKKLEMKIASLYEKKTNKYFNNKWKLTDLKITV